MWPCDELGTYDSLVWNKQVLKLDGWMFFYTGSEFSLWLTADGTSDQPPQVGSIRQVAILAPKHAEVGRVVAEKPARGGPRD